MATDLFMRQDWLRELAHLQTLLLDDQNGEIQNAESALEQLARAHSQDDNSASRLLNELTGGMLGAIPSFKSLNMDAKYRALLEQIPAVVFMASLDKGVGEAYVSPQIEAALGFSQSEWLEDPVRWYRQIHTDDKLRWSEEAAEMFASGRPLRSDYRVIARDGRVLWFHCEAQMIRREGGEPWFIHGVGFDITERKELEQALLEISSREQRRIGQDLHDGLGQHLTGIAFMSKVLEQKLVVKKAPEAEEAQKIVKLVNEAINKARELSHGLLPVMADAHGLMDALKKMCADVEDLFGISCRFHCERLILIEDVNAATHLYHIAQESVNNALKHGGATGIMISLSAANGEGVLAVRDNGKGIAEPAPGKSGMGLRIMSYRASMIGGSSEVQRNVDGGTTVTCRFPISEAAQEA